MMEYSAVARFELALVRQHLACAMIGLALLNCLDPFGKILAFGRPLFH